MKSLTCGILALLFLCTTSVNAVEPQISAGRYQNMAIDSDGFVYLWRADKTPMHRGLASLWQPGDSPTKVEGIPPAIAATASAGEYVDILTDDGAIYEWGYGPIQNEKAKAHHPLWGVCELLNIGSRPGSGPCGMDAADFDAAFFAEKPTRVKDIPPASAIVASNLHVMALTRNGEVYCWGIDAPAQRVPGLSDIVALSLGQDHAMALRKDGAVLSWGKRALGTPLSPQIDDHSLCDEPISYIVMRDAIGVYATDQNSYAWRKDGSLWAWGLFNNPYKRNRSWQVWQPEPAVTIPELKDIAVGPAQVVARTTDDKLYRWNTRTHNGLAGDPALSGIAPVDTNLHDATSIAIYSQALALTRDGYVCAWGSDANSSPHPVMLADGSTPLNLRAEKRGLPNASAPSCAVDNPGR